MASIAGRASLKEYEVIALNETTMWASPPEAQSLVIVALRISYHDMHSLDPAGEFLRISEHYRSLSDGELIVLAQHPSELTDVARQALANEISHRRLTVPPATTRLSATARSRLLKSRIPTTRPMTPLTWKTGKLVRDLHGLERAGCPQVQNLLDSAGIPFFMGPLRRRPVLTR